MIDRFTSLEADTYYDGERIWREIGSFTSYDSKMTMYGVISWLEKIEAECPEEVRNEIILVQFCERSYDDCPNDWKLLILRPLTKAENAARDAEYGVTQTANAPTTQPDTPAK